MYKKMRFSLMLMTVLILIGCISFGLWGCAAPKPPTPPTPPPAPPAPTYNATLTLTPTTVSLAIDEKTKMPKPLLTPVKFTGTGWKAGELVIVEIVGAAKGGGDISIASANADNNGAFAVANEGLAVIQGICGGKMVNMAPRFDPYQPIAAGKYTVRATGFDSKAQATATIEYTNP